MVEIVCPCSNSCFEKTRIEYKIQFREKLLSRSVFESKGTENKIKSQDRWRPFSFFVPISRAGKNNETVIGHISFLESPWPMSRSIYLEDRKISGITPRKPQRSFMAYHVQKIPEMRGTSRHPRGLCSPDRDQATFLRRQDSRHRVRSHQSILIPWMPSLLPERAAQHVPYAYSFVSFIQHEKRKETEREKKRREKGKIITGRGSSIL